jgi:S1-C subfamily serine protease
MRSDTVFALVAGAAALLVAAAVAPHAAAQSAPQEQPLTKKDPREAEAEREIQQMLGAIVRVRARALDDARSNATLGQQRTGSGIVVEPGWVLTIGYLVIEPDAIEVTSMAGRTLPATLAGYDHATGFGLLRVQGDLGVKPLAMGSAEALKAGESLIVAPFGGGDTASLARLVSKRQFTGSWEYLLDSALFTSPPNMAWAGAALVNRRFELVGVGSLFVRDSGEPGFPQPGNMFVPIDLLKPILADLKAKGRAAGPARPWVGMATESVKGELFVTRVSPDSPADLAGIREGDVVAAVGKDRVMSQEDLYRRMWALGAAGVDVPLRIVRDDKEREIKVKSIDRFEYFKAKKAL